MGQELTDSYYMMPFQGTLNMFFVMVLLLTLLSLHLIIFVAWDKDLFVQ